jgi:hypothetical protein
MCGTALLMASADRLWVLAARMHSLQVVHPPPQEILGLAKPSALRTAPGMALPPLPVVTTSAMSTSHSSSVYHHSLTASAPTSSPTEPLSAKVDAAIRSQKFYEPPSPPQRVSYSKRAWSVEVRACRELDALDCRKPCSLRLL